MNIDRLTRLANYLRQLPVEDFDMNTWDECDSAGCIGWHAVDLFGKYSPLRSMGEQAKEALDLDYDRADDLFFPHDPIYFGATPTQAARVIEYLVKTGEVDWGIVQAELVEP